VGGGVQLGPLGTEAINRPIVPAPGDYDGEIGGMMIGRGNRSTRRKPVPMPLCPPQTPHTLHQRDELTNFFRKFVSNPSIIINNFKNEGDSFVYVLRGCTIEVFTFFFASSVDFNG
jgi:hypothetical protein